MVGISLVWLTYLTIIQLFSGPRRDSKSLLPVPPRKVQGNGALPVLGHTLLFLRAGGDVASHFKSEWREWTWNPWSRKLGDCFSIFIWGKWRVIVTGPERCKYLMENSELSQGWAWSPPITLLGQNCLPLLKDDDEEVEYLRQMIEEPLSHESIVLQAPQFAKIAKKCIDNLLLDRKFSNNVEASKDAQGSMLEPNKICRNKDNGEDNNDDILLVRTDSVVLAVFPKKRAIQMRPTKSSGRTCDHIPWICLMVQFSILTALLTCRPPRVAQIQSITVTAIKKGAFMSMARVFITQ